MIEAHGLLDMSDENLNRLPYSVAVVAKMMIERDDATRLKLPRDDAKELGLVPDHDWDIVIGNVKSYAVVLIILERGNEPGWGLEMTHECFDPERPMSYQESLVGRCLEILVIHTRGKIVSNGFKVRRMDAVSPMAGPQGKLPS